MVGRPGFSEDCRDFCRERTLYLVRESGFEALDPQDGGIESPAPEAEKQAWDRFNMLAGERNAKMIESSNGMLAVLDGTDVDSATASETGCAFALGKKIPGCRGDFRLAGDNPEAPLISRSSASYEKAAAGQLAPQRIRQPRFRMFFPTERPIARGQLGLTTPPVSVT